MRRKSKRGRSEKQDGLLITKKERIDMYGQKSVYTISLNAIKFACIWNGVWFFAGISSLSVSFSLYCLGDREKGM